MNRYQRQTDFYWLEQGDLFLDSSTGDLADTKNHQYRGFIQRVLTQIMSRKGEWQNEQSVGVNLDDFLGKRNNAANGERLKSRIMTELVKNQLVSASDLNVSVFPTSNTSLAIIVSIQPPGTAKRIVLTFSYDMRDNHIVPRNV